MGEVINFKDHVIDDLPPKTVGHLHRLQAYWRWQARNYHQMQEAAEERKRQEELQDE